MSHTFFVKFQVFKRNFSETIWYIGLKFSEISVALSTLRDIILLASSYDDEHMLMKQKR